MAKIMAKNSVPDHSLCQQMSRCRRGRGKIRGLSGVKQVSFLYELAMKAETGAYQEGTKENTQKKFYFYIAINQIVMKSMKNFFKKRWKKFCRYKKMLYLCTRNHNAGWSRGSSLGS